MNVENDSDNDPVLKKAIRDVEAALRLLRLRRRRLEMMILMREHVASSATH